MEGSAPAGRNCSELILITFGGSLRNFQAFSGYISCQEHHIVTPR